MNRFALELIGLWPDIDEVVKSHLVSDLRVAFVFVTVTFVSGIPLLSALVKVWGDMVLMIDNLQITLPLLIVSLKLAVMRWKRTDLVPMVRTMAEDWTEWKSDVERDVMMRRARTARLIVIIGYILMVLAFSMLIVLPCFGVTIRHVTNLTDRTKPLPLQTYYFYNTDESPLYELTYVVQAVTIFVAAVTYTGVDAFLGLTILHICGQLERFSLRLTHLISSKDFSGALSDNVATHLRLIRFASSIEDTFALMMMGLVIYFGIVFCLYGFLFLTIITEKDVNNVSFARLIYVMVGVVTLLGHTFLYCGAGEIITEKCEGVYRAMCNLEWYRLEPRKARALMLLIMRAHEPFHISAGKIIPLTMTTFCSLLKTSAGYISFLLAKRS